MNAPTHTYPLNGAREEHIVRLILSAEGVPNQPLGSTLYGDQDVLWSSVYELSLHGPRVAENVDGHRRDHNAVLSPPHWLTCMKTECGATCLEHERIVTE